MTTEKGVAQTLTVAPRLDHSSLKGELCQPAAMTLPSSALHSFPEFREQIEILLDVTR